MCGNSSTLTVGNSYATVEDDHVIHTSVITAHDGTCTRYGPNVDVLGTSCIDIYCTTKILPAMVDLVTMLSKLIVSSLPTVVATKEVG